MKDKLKVLKKVQKILSENKDLIDGVSGLNIGSVNCEVLKLEKSIEFDIEIKGGAHSNTWFSVLQFSRSYDINIGLFGENHQRTISWSDDNKQPRKSGEWLYRISFSTGAYIFGDSYPVETFKAFFNELKSYNPKYSDTTNKSLYFTKETANKVHNDFDGIFKKYQGLVAAEVKANKIKKMKEELSKLES